MVISRFKKTNEYVVFFSVLLAIIVTLYSFVPQVIADFDPLSANEIETLMKENKSFVSDGNIDSMLSLYHPDFIMEAIHASGRKETFNKSQILKHEEVLTKTFSLSLIEGTHITSIIDSSSAIVSTTGSQIISIAGLLASKEKIYQTIYVVKYKGNPKILKVLSIAEKI